MTEAEHKEERVAHYDRTAGREAGFVAWCKCGIGSSIQPSAPAARRALAIHLSDPTRLPR